MINRTLSPQIARSKKSILLLGPRQVGKSTLIKSLKPQLIINLSLEHEYLLHTSDPKALIDKIESFNAKTVFIDEVQRIPSIMNTVQALIDEKKNKFYLTGSSARKLKRGGANLLPGRLFSFELGPVTASEMNYKLSTPDALSWGTLPELLTEKKRIDREHLLRSYSGTYLKEEILSEALVRNLEAFSRFLVESTSWVGQFIDFSKLSKKAKISRHSCPRFFEIFEDTLIANRVYPFKPCLESSDLVKHPKFYFFDCGVLNGLLNNFILSNDRIGMLSEQLVYSQLMSSAKSQRHDINIETFRTRGGFEIDFIVTLEKNVFALEIKSSDNIIESDLSSLKAFKNHYNKKYTPFVWHMGHQSIKKDGIWCLPWQQGLKEIGI